MIQGGGDDIWRVLALVDLSCPDADDFIEHTLAVATRLRGEVTLLSVVDRPLYARGKRYGWPRSAFGATRPKLDIHRVVLPGPTAEAISSYAERIRADLLFVAADYRDRQWFRKGPLAPAAALTSRPLWIQPTRADAWSANAPLRVACVVRLDGTDDRSCRIAQSVAERSRGEVVLTCIAGSERRLNRRTTAAVVDRSAALDAMQSLGRLLTVPWSAFVIEDRSCAALAAAVVERNFGADRRRPSDVRQSYARGCDAAVGTPLCVPGYVRSVSLFHGHGR